MDQNFQCSALTRSSTIKRANQSSSKGTIFLNRRLRLATRCWLSAYSSAPRVVCGAFNDNADGLRSDLHLTRFHPIVLGSANVDSPFSLPACSSRLDLIVMLCVCLTSIRPTAISQTIPRITPNHPRGLSGPRSPRSRGRLDSSRACRTARRRSEHAARGEAGKRVKRFNAASSDRAIRGDRTSLEGA